MDIAERIFSEMKKKGLTQKDLAALLDMTQSSIAHWKGRGSKIPIDSILAICDILEISPNYLFTGEESAEHYTEDEQLLIAQYRKLDANSKDEILQYTTFKAQTQTSLRNRVPNANFALAVTNAAQAMEKTEVKGILKAGKKKVTIKKEAST